LCTHALGEASGADRRRGELRAERLVPLAAALAGAAGEVVDERDALSGGRLGDDFVAEHLSSVLGLQLLQVGAAEAAGEDADGLPRAVRLVDLREVRLPVRP
jgi:hypothetical protein